MFLSLMCSEYMHICYDKIMFCYVCLMPERSALNMLAFILDLHTLNVCTEKIYMINNIMVQNSSLHMLKKTISIICNGIHFV